ncbi:MAG: superoxide dismutase [Nitrospirae bacterium]|nr:superoxide dismutase [Candidatus Manganitrophaceae bacterium]
MPHQLPALPWAKDALAPHISPETIDFHYGKHHNSYVGNLNGLLEGTDLGSKSLEELIQKSDTLPADKKTGIFNNAAQIYNHSFYWNCLSPNGGGAPTGKIAEAINDTFGSFEAFKTQFSTAAAKLFGSGWAWLAKDDTGTLSIIQASNAGCPLSEGKTPILTCDVWEHAYYIDYRNARPKYVEAFWNLVNWEFVEGNL